MPTALPNLYCTPQDIYELVGIEPAQLRLDDQNLATGQSITTNADAAAGATTISVDALTYALLRGTNLVFSDAGLANPVEATLTQVASAGATTLTVSALGSAINSGAIAKDNGVNVWLAAMMTRACTHATARVKLYCAGRYEDTSLKLSWSVNLWATKIAAYWLSKRLYRAPPQGIKDDYDETMDELRMVKDSELNIEDIGTRTSGWPAFSNVTIDLLSPIRRVRVEPSISEPTPTQFSQSVDYNSYLMLDF